MSLINVNIKKKLNEFTLDTQFCEEGANIIVVLGESGCGKSTLLNSIAGIVTPDSGEITVNNNVLFNKDKNINVPIYKRKIGYIQQKNNLFPHISVEDNIKYGLKENSINFGELINELEIKEILTKYPNEISGGQGQRVSIARSIVTNPSVLLMDEPFSALDNVMRLNLRNLVKKLNRDLKVPIIFVTHDLEEAYYMGDKIIVMNRGTILQVGNKEEIFNSPSCTKVRDFIKNFNDKSEMIT